jgi:hypothetical protein
METIIVDSHSEVLPYWFKEYIKQKLPLVVIRIDRHHDMSHDSPTLPAREGRPVFEYLAKIMPYLLEYAKRELNEGNFTCPAFHYGIIGAMYHFNPREEKIDAYGRVCGTKFINPPKTKKEPVQIGGKRGYRIVWDGALTKLKIRGGKVIPAPQSITLDEFGEDLGWSCFPAVIGFDLDGLYGIGDEKPVEDTVARRIERVKCVLEHVSSPLFTCIARSQTPRAYVPPETVDCLQKRALDLIKMIYI